MVHLVATFGEAAVLAIRVTLAWATAGVVTAVAAWPGRGRATVLTPLPQGGPDTQGDLLGKAAAESLC